MKIVELFIVCRLWNGQKVTKNVLDHRLLSVDLLEIAVVVSLSVTPFVYIASTAARVIERVVAVQFLCRNGCQPADYVFDHLASSWRDRASRLEPGFSPAIIWRILPGYGTWTTRIRNTDRTRHLDRVEHTMRNRVGQADIRLFHELFARLLAIEVSRDCGPRSGRVLGFGFLSEKCSERGSPLFRWSCRVARV